MVLYLNPGGGSTRLTCWMKAVLFSKALLFSFHKTFDNYVRTAAVPLSFTFFEGTLHRIVTNT